LNILTAYWCYGPSKSSSLLSIDGAFSPTASMVALGEKLGIDPQIG
jgi:hypothetical protein